MESIELVHPFDMYEMLNEISPLAEIIRVKGRNGDRDVIVIDGKKYVQTVQVEPRHPKAIERWNEELKFRC